MEDIKHFCPICNVELRPVPRYPNYVCGSCKSKATDKNGRLLSFYNVHIFGGFEARYRDNGEYYYSNFCYINDIRCIADEARFGGIVIEIETNKHYIVMAKEDSLPKYYQDSLDELRKKSIHELIEEFNRVVDNQDKGWYGTIGAFLKALNDSFMERNYILDKTVFMSDGMSLRWKLKIEANKIISVEAEQNPRGGKIWWENIL